MQRYEFVAAGGGLAGLSLACQLIRSRLCGSSLLVVDRNPPGTRARSWSYWTDRPTIFDPIVCHRWSKLQVTIKGVSRVIALPGYRYEMVRGADLERFARQELSAHAGITFQVGAVDQILDGPGAARLIIDGELVEADWVFDSTQWAKARSSSWRANRLPMHFQGWAIETTADTFDPETATFLDFRTPQCHGVRFFYVLPFTERQALVQYVLFAPDCPKHDEARAALQTYLSRAWGLGDYSIGAEEAGSLPISASRRPRRLGPHVMAIGIKAGLVKPTTGFGFWRIQQDSAAIVRSLEQTSAPWDVPPISERHRLYDSLLLDVLARRSSEIEVIFGHLFAHNPIERVLRFLDETTTSAEDLALIATLPPGAFIESAARSLVFAVGPH